MRRNGFTLTELLVIIGVLVILSAMALPAFQIFAKKSDVASGAQNIIAALRLAQNKALSSDNASPWGVYFDSSVVPNSYTIFKGANFAARDASFDTVNNLSKKTELYEVNFGGSPEVIFNRPRGDTAQAGTVKLKSTFNPAETKTITVNSMGLAVLGEDVAPSVLPQKDSRHVHFDYNQNVQSAATLQLIFPDYPDDNYNIDFQTYLNADKTEFFWEGTVPVGPIGNKTDQKLKIHTHSLTAIAAQFSVHRDRRYNDKVLKIHLSDDTSGSLIEYTADGQESRGTSIYLVAGEAGDPQRQ
ncbi:MAG: hypothetical protein A2667_02160 [Candidatus Wildermuthbacteria bacterium RIFCSPHIGHO2_01_FULL_47_27]|uniref:General secretion pathway GspH domain-containing protein n=2 Tax=Candidatus Wildermuthiibacteriota TaxID=1817923 RepID=A0A1G2RRC1_9BACT|nr:MAG: Type IV pilin PilA [Parcubacteria group bacterium GW2011_GWA2_47_9]OHA64323.1 MAG: hypothetical protein A2667_02160 [Candidatus Wildermuthbacteria bacterium RIFCSPHIGHO2_01_FULL_47_27]OHA68961.1 MAG: hypothetical protein A3D59_00785 [Candidatus Wildermuthbacteria bacterium RIFCSPHIGHO2_02_FULL_47_17]OHA75404.1 MAG: hypothetical protein A3A32_00675 [Candidatus Wildermuthbacteria bacterium RIFCSPLOWO2_01_FULL_48_35]